MIWMAGPFAGVSGRKKPPSTLAKSKKKSKTPEGTVQGAELNGQSSHRRQLTPLMILQCIMLRVWMSAK